MNEARKTQLRAWAAWNDKAYEEHGSEDAIFARREANCSGKSFTTAVTKRSKRLRSMVGTRARRAAMWSSGARADVATRLSG